MKNQQRINVKMTKHKYGQLDTMQTDVGAYQTDMGANMRMQTRDLLSGSDLQLSSRKVLKLYSSKVAQQ